MKKMRIKRLVVSFFLIMSLALSVSSVTASAATRKNHNGCDKIEYGMNWAGNPYAKSYLNKGILSAHWASCYVRENGSYVVRDTPYKGWTASATAKGTWWYHYSVNCGTGRKTWVTRK